jgi:NADH-quinone oxidoreductase subunit H
MRAWLDGIVETTGLAPELVHAAGILAAAVMILLPIVGLAGMTVYLERRVAGRMQARIGPNRVGPQGLFQFIADALKLVGKEDVIPDPAAKVAFRLAPLIVFIGAFAPFAVIPFGYGVVAADMNIALFVVLGITSVEVVGIIMAGWASNSKWTMLGSMREVAQMVSYELPLGLAALSVVVLAGTLNLTTIAEQQTGGVWNWYVFRGPFAFVAFFIFATATLAGLKRAPFDLPEAESELVSGFHTEYTGFRFAAFFLGEYTAMILFSLFGTVLFLGGWDPGIPVALDAGIGRWVGVLVVFTKAFVLIFIMIWLRWSLPRYRIDKVMYLCYKVLLPWSVVCVVGAALQVLIGHSLGCGWLMGR